MDREKITRQDGFTLAELLVTLLLAAAVLGFAVPSLSQSWQELQLDMAIQQFHRDLRWAQQLAFREQTSVTVTFFRDKQPYRYAVRLHGSGKNLRYRTLPDHLDRMEAQLIVIYADRQIKNNYHILLQKGEHQRYVYYYRTGRSRVVKKTVS